MVTGVTGWCRVTLTLPVPTPDITRPRDPASTRPTRTGHYLGDSRLPYLEINFTCEWHSCSQPCISPTSFKWSLAQAPVKNLLPQWYLSLMPRDTQSVQIVIAT